MDKPFRLIENQEYKGSKNKLLFRCLKCKKENSLFKMNLDSIFGNRGCPVCNSSKGEQEIKRVLRKYKIKHKQWFYFLDCKDIRPLIFDFKLYDYNVNIEFNGLQHYEARDFFGGEKHFEIQKRHDNIKRNYCKINNIRLIEIPYWDFDKIESILIKELNLQREEVN